MRPYPTGGDELYDDPSPRVVPIGQDGLPRAGEAADPSRRPEPWTPRDYPLPASSRRTERRPDVTPAPEPRLTSTHKLMLAAFGLVCLAMVLGTILWRLFNDARLAVEPASTPAAVVQQAAPRDSQTQPPGAAPGPAPGTGPITTEIRVVQPNYTIAPGDTLASIARRHGTTVDALASINNLENRNSLSVGQRLIIP